jgi:hypothetical protein
MLERNDGIEVDHERVANVLGARRDVLTEEDSSPVVGDLLQASASLERVAIGDAALYLDPAAGIHDAQQRVL